MITRPRTFLDVWSRRTGPERFDSYTRWSLYFLSGTEPFIALALIGSDRTFDPSVARFWLALVLVHTVVCILTLRAGIGHFLGGRRVHPVLRVLLGVLTLAVAALAVGP